MVGIAGASRLLAASWDVALAGSVVAADMLSGDIEARHAVMNAALAVATAFAIGNLVMEHATVEHGRVRAVPLTKWPMC